MRGSVRVGGVESGGGEGAGGCGKCGSQGEGRSGQPPVGRCRAWEGGSGQEFGLLLMVRGADEGVLPFKRGNWRGAWEAQSVEVGLLVSLRS